jgi:multidrug resistance efflux pump
LWLACKPATPSNLVSGTIATDEAHLASRYGGRVEKIFVLEGQPLQAGQVLLQLEARELLDRERFARAYLAELKAGPRPQEMEAARLDAEAFAADLQFAKLEQDRANELFGQKTISEAERDRAVSRANVLAKQWAAAKSRYDLLLAGTRSERIAQAEAQLAEITTQLSEMRILAPTNCVLETLQVKVGDVLSPGREVATVLLTEHLWVRVFVPETWLGRIKSGLKVSVKVDSDRNETFSGEVEQINRAAEFTPRNVQTVDERVKQVFGVKIRLQNKTDKLRAGMAADVAFPTSVTGSP